MSLQGYFATSPCVFMSKRLLVDNLGSAKNQPHVKESHGNQGVYWNAVVFFSARVLSHCGFILSLLAVWLAWLVPPVNLSQPVIQDIKNLKTRSKIRPPLAIAPDAHKGPAPILAKNSTNNNNPARRVYFADSASTSTIATTQITAVMQSSVAHQAPVKLTSGKTTNTSESFDSLVMDSDSSSRPSSLKQTKFNYYLRSNSLDLTGDAGSPFGNLLQNGQQPPSFAKQSPRFPFRRCSAPIEQTDRASKPTPRTMPYGPPYFATPPTVLDDRQLTSSRRRPRFKEELPNSRAPESDSELSRGRTIRRVRI